jgi:NAD(P)H-dependent flavin oxidoreductase YrpB (nitropropane dioxygenase family)
MDNKKLPDLVIGNLKINPPIIQGGMGVRISKANLAAAVSNEGALGVIASVGLGNEAESEKDYVASSEKALREQIRKTKVLTRGYIGVNIMFVLTNYESLVKASAEEGADLIISGAGLPLRLPGLVHGKNPKLVPIVSSGRAADIICKTWLRKFKRLPDAMVVEGPLAGGHLGFSLDELERISEFPLEKLLKDVLAVVKEYEKVSHIKIPVIPAGGIYDGKDIAKMLKLGASGVQIATRFVCTMECDASQEFKQAFLNARKEDIVIIESPVGLPGRVIKNEFVKRIQKRKKLKFKCPYKCLKTCDGETAHYCVADALVNAHKGDLKNGFAMCGANAYRVDKIVTVRELINELVDEATSEYYGK